MAEWGGADAGEVKQQGIAKSHLPAFAEAASTDSLSQISLMFCLLIGCGNGVLQAWYLVHLSQRISSGARGEEGAVRRGMDGDMYRFNLDLFTVDPLETTSKSELRSASFPRPWQRAGPQRQEGGPPGMRHRGRGQTKEVGLEGRSHREGGRAIGKSEQQMKDASRRVLGSVTPSIYHNQRQQPAQLGPRNTQGHGLIVNTKGGGARGLLVERGDVTDERTCLVENGEWMCGCSSYPLYNTHIHRQPCLTGPDNNTEGLIFGPCHTHQAFSYALPSDQRAAPWQPTGLPTLSSSSSLGNQPTTAAPATASAPLNLPRQLLLTLNQFRFIFDSLAGGHGRLGADAGAAERRNDHFPMDPALPGPIITI
ncbi:hypothetical protein EYF80_023300 [Liparis tanakae]|uniref:Uncharacterized protein n=1 Tax=Liparis tanakae TaxID=230148 RepID=A0A4Z2HL96_9TELE|nr:hypothetical protein EYF80_023300 [Liparis tanakae]